MQASEVFKKQLIPLEYTQDSESLQLPLRDPQSKLSTALIRHEPVGSHGSVSRPQLSRHYTVGLEDYRMRLIGLVRNGTQNAGRKAGARQGRQMVAMREERIIQPHTPLGGAHQDLSTLRQVSNNKAHGKTCVPFILAPGYVDCDLDEMMSLLSITVYFVLNLCVTITNQSIILRTQSPYLLTALHAAASYVSTLILARLQEIRLAPLRTNPHRFRVLCFSCLFTINIALSSRALGMVSLPIHQTIRAFAPVLTVAFTVVLELRKWSSYSLSTFLSLLPIMTGVIIATYHKGTGTSVHGLVLTFLGAVTAVLKTIATYTFQNHYGIGGLELINVTAPVAVLQALLMALWYGDLSRIASLYHHSTASVDKAVAGGWLLAAVLLNTLLAALLNLSSFEANRRCGPVSMGVTANLKQVVILLLPYVKDQAQPKPQILIGGLMTIAGGIWYARAQHHERRTRVSSELPRDVVVQKRRRAQSVV